MTSVQQVDQGVSPLTAEERATISEAMKEAQTLLENNNNDANEIQLATVAGVMKNSQNRPLMLNKTLDGFGVFVVAPPTNVGGNNGSGEFIHRAPTFPHIPGGGGHGPVIIGCKAALIYGTFDKALPQLGYLLAWFKAQSSDEHKVYVETGDLSKLMEMEWSDVEQKLDASSNQSRYVDSETGAMAAAQINLLGDNLALLGASFDRVLFDENTSQS
ncbi:uncharacterized protein LOC110736340 [Chenopodium quinoa]|uniref:Uncharacterized protein n=1 Tax=Chenopodium quinoa TaxID=63459 RepID=A0A803KMH8_CHEQI|nr:uncharacterized protein LOC110736340 [Chenopodium quinoa]XP_021772232.1 uncharacterized protein LOC110736340 [Chenopodium quinoa]